MIEVTLILKQKELDVFVPNKISFGRLKHLLHQALAENGTNISSDFQVIIQDKSFRLGNFDTMDDFPLANGERLEILLGEANAVI
jgi:uncharacterized ubiquitin-like protein YukD